MDNKYFRIFLYGASVSATLYMLYIMYKNHNSEYVKALKKFEVTDIDQIMNLNTNKSFYQENQSKYLSSNNNMLNNLNTSTSSQSYENYKNKIDKDYQSSQMASKSSIENNVSDPEKQSPYKKFF